LVRVRVRVRYRVRVRVRVCVRVRVRARVRARVTGRCVWGWGGGGGRGGGGATRKVMDAPWWLPPAVEPLVLLSSDNDFFSFFCYSSRLSLRSYLICLSLLAYFLFLPTQTLSELRCAWLAARAY
jgi:hypothetical protein